MLIRELDTTACEASQSFMQHRVLVRRVALFNRPQSIKLAGLGFAGGGVPGGGGGGLGRGGPSSIPPGTCDVSFQFAF